MTPARRRVLDELSRKLRPVEVDPELCCPELENHSHEDETRSHLEHEA